MRMWQKPISFRNSSCSHSDMSRELRATCVHDTASNFQTISRHVEVTRSYRGAPAQTQTRQFLSGLS
jgi:hypothetical protein